MRKFILILIINCLLLIVNSFAQAPDKVNYQGIARDISGVELPNQLIGLRLSIRQGGNNGTIVYQESHNPVTNL